VFTFLYTGVAVTVAGTGKARQNVKTKQKRKRKAGKNPRKSKLYYNATLMVFSLQDCLEFIYPKALCQVFPIHFYTKLY
jgi:hypothetical protein